MTLATPDLAPGAPPQAGRVLGLPYWPAEPEPVDPTGASCLVLCFGTSERAAQTARRWVTEASARMPTRLVVADDLGSGRADVSAALSQARTGVRIMLVGPQFDLLQGLALARAHGAGPAELRAFAVDADARSTDLPVYCAHCRDTRRVHGAPGGEVDCPGCGRRLEIHSHHSAGRGSFLASDATARDIA